MADPWTRQDPREPSEAAGRITGGKTMTLAEMRAERDRLALAITAAEETWDCGHGALQVSFGYDYQKGRCFRMLSGGSLRLEWLEIPEPDRMLDVVAALLGGVRRPGRTP